MCPGWLLGRLSVMLPIEGGRPGQVCEVRWTRNLQLSFWTTLKMQRGATKPSAGTSSSGRGRAYLCLPPYFHLVSVVIPRGGADAGQGQLLPVLGPKTGVRPDEDGPGLRHFTVYAKQCAPRRSGVRQEGSCGANELRAGRAQRWS